MQVLNEIAARCYASSACLRGSCSPSLFLHVFTLVLMFAFFILLDQSLVGSFSAKFISCVFTKESGDYFCGGGLWVDVS